MISRAVYKEHRGRKPITAFAILTLIAGVLVSSSSALAVHDDNLFELDKNASNNTNVTQIGDLGSNVTVGATALPVCQTETPPATPFTVLVEAELMTVTAIADGNFGGNCGGLKKSYTVTRGVASTTATAHAKGNPQGAISLVTSATKAGPDWDQVFAQVQGDPNTKCVSLGLVECTYIHDDIGPTIFTGGSTKDHLPVSGWLHKSGESPDKGEILNAYAAKGIAGSNQILYFGMDRYAVDGSTDIGFWFFKDQVVACPDLTAGDACDGVPDGSFVGNQSIGDLLILGTFTQGGATSNIRVFQWVGSGGNESDTIQGPSAAFGDCVPGQSGDNGCATVNDTSIVAPWGANYIFKGSAKSGWIPEGGFFEGGIDLTASGLEGCFSTFLAETRSSPEITAVLKDFALGSFEACGSTLTTTPGDGTTAGTALTDSNANSLPDISIGTGTVAVKDRASLAVTGISTWTGTMSFFLCGPITTGTCTTGGVQIGSAQTVNQSTTQPILSAAANLTSVGRYCWRGFFDSGTQGVPDATDAGPGECFEVLPVTPALDTQAVASPVDFGQAVQDNATLSGTATQPGTNGPNTTYPTINATNGAAAGGKITFTLLKSDCTTLATGTGTNPQDVTVSGDNTYGPVSFTPDAPGTYHWKAQYVPATGDPNNIGSTHNATCADSDETVVVNQIPTALTTRQFVFPQDKVTITTTPTGATLDGNVRFTLHDSLAECQSRTDIKYDSNNIAVSGASPQSKTTTNTTYRITDGTTHYWNVSYTSNTQAQTNSSSVCTETTAVTYAGNDTGISIP